MSKLLGWVVSLVAGRFGGYIILGVFIAFSVTLFAAYEKGKSAARAAEALKTARATISALENERARNFAATEEASKRAIERAAKASALEDEVAAYVSELEKIDREGRTLVRQQNERIEDYEERLRHAARGCLLDGRDIERLHRIK